MFADQLLRHFLHMPVEEEGRLVNKALRENFVTRVFAYHRWQSTVESNLDTATIQTFHRRHKFLLMAHGPEGARLLGATLGRAVRHASLNRLAAEYLSGFSSVMSRTPTRKGHTNVLQHLAGYVSNGIDAADRRELTNVIDEYRRELLPLIVPVSLIRHYVRKLELPYLVDQVYLNPHPHELMLLNHV